MEILLAIRAMSYILAIWFIMVIVANVMKMMMFQNDDASKNLAIINIVIDSIRVCILAVISALTVARAESQAILAISGIAVIILLIVGGFYMVKRTTQEIKSQIEE